MDKDNEVTRAPPVQTTPGDRRPTLKHNFAGKINRAAQRMSSQTARVLLKDFPHITLQAIRGDCCHGQDYATCKGDRWFWSSECRFYCADFIDAALTTLGDVIVTEAE